MLHCHYIFSPADSHKGINITQGSCKIAVKNRLKQVAQGLHNDGLVLAEVRRCNTHSADRRIFRSQTLDKRYAASAKDQFDFEFVEIEEEYQVLR
jgi:hypothetical protein